MLFTIDGVTIKPGLRVFTINCRWGTVVDEPGSDGWFHVDEDDHGRVLMDGVRVSTKNRITGKVDPRG